MCKNLGIPLLGKLPLDPRIGKGTHSFYSTKGTGKFFARFVYCRVTHAFCWPGKCCDEGKSFLTEVSDSPAAKCFLSIIKGKLNKRKRTNIFNCLRNMIKDLFTWQRLQTICSAFSREIKSQLHQCQTSFLEGIFLTSFRLCQVLNNSAKATSAWKLKPTPAKQANTRNTCCIC